MKDLFINLINAVKAEPDEEERNFLLETINDKADNFPNYVEKVFMMEISTPIIYARYDGQELRDKISQLDDRRRSAHDAAIAACGFFNRLCDSYGVARFCPETNDRTVVADFVGTFVYQIYLSGTGHSNGMDDIISFMKKQNISSIPKKEVAG